WSRGARLYAPRAAGAWRDYEVTGRVQFEERGGSLGIVLYATRAADGIRGYELGRREGEPGFRLRRIPDDTPRSVDSAPVGEQEGYSFRLRAATEPSATRVAWKLWSEHEPEPAAWGGELSDEGPDRPVGGTIGIASGGWQGGRQKYVSDLRVR